MLLPVLLMVVGFVLLIKGADWLVKGASTFAKKKNVSDLAIGLTIVAFGTSAPELFVNAFASFNNHQEIVFGNVIGSNNFNLFVILGVAGLITPLAVQSSTVWKEIPISLIGALLLYLLVNSFFSDENILSRFDGVILLVGFCFFLFYVYKNLKSEPVVGESYQTNMSAFKIWALIIFGLVGLIIGGQLVVDSAMEMAQAFGLSEKIIGLTIVAAGTSLPELATSVVAAIKKNNDIAVGNIVGSNIFNIFLILGASSMIRPIAFDTAFNTDLYLLGAGTILLFLAMFVNKKMHLERWQAGIFLVIFVAYTAYLIYSE